jgi:hypothetical protein
VGALGHYIEREGVPTAQVSLIREQTAAIRPPRALWVPFMLGRPFGAPGDPDFQRRVLLHLLRLFERASGPVLEDFPEDAPAAESDAESGFACPVSFAKAVDDRDPAAAMLGEIAQLAPWYDLALGRRGRTSFGISGLSIEDAARHAASYLNGASVPTQGEGRLAKTLLPPQGKGWDGGGLTPGVQLKRACDDIKTYYYEAAAAQPGNLSPRAIDAWFWRETAAAKAFLALRQVCLESDDKSLKPLGQTSLVPRWVQHQLA